VMSDVSLFSYYHMVHALAYDEPQGG